MAKAIINILDGEWIRLRPKCPSCLRSMLENQLGSNRINILE